MGDVVSGAVGASWQLKTSQLLMCGNPSSFECASVHYKPTTSYKVIKAYLKCTRQIDHIFTY
jgi:hypothetical protein